MTDLLTACKLNMRITTTSFDSEIGLLINEAQADITSACDSEFDGNNPDECRLVILYVKGMFGDGDSKSWELYKERLSVIGTRKIDDE